MSLVGIYPGRASVDDREDNECDGIHTIDG